MLSCMSRRNLLLFSVAVIAPLAFSVQIGWTQAVDSDSRRLEYDAIAKQARALEQVTSLLRRIVKHAQPTVVHIEAQKNDQGNTFRRVTEAGAGVIVRYADKHYAITNLHVVRDARLSGIKVILADGRHTRPTRKWQDRDTDLAVLAIDTSNLAAARAGDSDKLEIGDFVMALGSPFGLSHSVTFGILSAKGRYDLKLGEQEVIYQQFLQTDAAINPGNSGGPLINLRGEVIGINTAIASNSGGNEGIGFAIPMNIVTRTAKQLIKGDFVSRGYLGVMWDERFDQAQAIQLGLSSPRGARLAEIKPNSPAEKAKLQVGDVILQFDGISVESGEHLRNLTGLTVVGSEVDLLIYRSGKSLPMQLTLMNRPAEN